ncbi:MAG: 2-dehydro-3-deoxygalactonokinase [Sediminispirochaetaceae bacterium]
MRIVTIDCGTTNSRVYVIDEEGNVYGKGTRKVGVRDTSITGSRARLQAGLKEAIDEALGNAGIGYGDIAFIISSGMITSEIGLKELPHLAAPVSMDDLADNIERIEDPAVFPPGVPVYFIRGIKNSFGPGKVQFGDVGRLDFMRGEEAQVAGLLKLELAQPPFSAVILSSHTKYIPVDGDGAVQGSVTTLSGQVFEALLSSSSIGKSMMPDDDESRTHDSKHTGLDEEVIESAFRWIGETGLLRSLLMTRFLDVLMETEWRQRRLFVEACIAAEDIKALSQYPSLGFEKDTPYVLIGKSGRCELYRSLISRKAGVTHDIHIVSEEQIIDSLSIQGALYLAKKAHIY